MSNEDEGGAWFDPYAKLWLFRCKRPGCRWKTEMSFRTRSKNPSRYDYLCRTCRRAMEREQELRKSL